MRTDIERDRTDGAVSSRTLHHTVQRGATEARLRFQAQLLDAVQHAVIATDLNGIILSWNTYAEHLYGWSAEEVLGRNILDVIHSVKPEKYAAEIFERIRKGESWAGELEVRRRDGTTLWASVVDSPIHNTNGELIGVVAVSTDVTEARESHEGLRASEEHFKILFESAPDGIYVMDMKGTFLDGNRAAEEIVGVPREHLIGKSFVTLDLLDRKAWVRAVTLLGRSALGRPTGPDEFELRRPDGTTIPVEIRTYPIEIAGRRLVLGIARDITDRHETQRALRQSEERFRALVEHSGVGVWQLDPGGYTAYVNPAMCEMLEVTDAEALAGTSYEQFFTPESVTVVQRERQKRGRGVASTYEVTMIGAAGTERRVLISGAPLMAPDGTLLGLMGAVVDMTERKQLEEQLSQAQKMESVGRLAGGVAHDFNNILTAIFGNADLLLEDLPKNSAARRDVEEIRTAAQRAAGLTSQLLAFSRKQVLVPQVLDINTLIRETEKMLRRLIGEDIDLVTALQAALGAIEADPGQLQQIVLNLAVNARDAMPKGGKLTISTMNVELDERYSTQHPEVIPGRYAMLAVADTGTGMSASTKARIFEPFFTTKGPGKGTGLGLSTVYGIVKQSGGHISVDSEPGRGATFKVYLPRTDRPVEELAASSDGITLHGSETILLVEDDSAVRVLTSRVLESFGYRVLSAPEAQSAEQLCARHGDEVDLLLTDVVMPGRSGRQLADHLRHRCPQLKVLFMSGYTGDAVLHHGVLGSDVPFIQKPFPPLTLASKVREVLDAA